MDQLFCMICLGECQQTDHFEVEENELLLKMKTRLDITFAAAIYQYYKKGHIQKAIHRLKYSSDKGVAIWMGKRFAEKYNNCVHNRKADFVIPIPTSKKRMWKRGYNQAEVFAASISRYAGLELRKDILLKPQDQATLTYKTRKSRFDVVKSSFKVDKRQSIRSKCVLLVDDVITTGATMEAATRLLLDAGCASVQWGLMAKANN